MSLETSFVEDMRLDAALLVVGVAYLGCGVNPMTLCLSWLGYTGIFPPRVPLFKGQDWGDPSSGGSAQEGFGVQPKTFFLEVLLPTRHVQGMG